jgi:hypothetical protein
VLDPPSLWILPRLVADTATTVSQVPRLLNAARLCLNAANGWAWILPRLCLNTITTVLESCHHCVLGSATTVFEYCRAVANYYTTVLEYCHTTVFDDCHDCA